MRHSTSIGIDTHAKKNSVCALIEATGETVEATLSEDPMQLIRWIAENGFPEPIRLGYEAGPTGFGLARALEEEGYRCVVMATSKLPQRIDRRKNDRIDAQWLARMLAAGSVREVYVPDIGQEALCHLSRLRSECASDLKRARQRVASFLLLTKTSYTLTKKRWTKTFRAWAGSYEFADPSDTFVFRQKMQDVSYLEQKLRLVEDEIAHTVRASGYLSAMAARLTSIHGIGPVTAFSLLAEVYDFTRFKSGSAFASYVGLVPSEHSSGKRACRGAIAKQGNANLRRLLIEAVSAYSRSRKAPVAADIPGTMQAKASRCTARLYERRRCLTERGLHPNKVKAALARELCEWVYWIAVGDAA